MWVPNSRILKKTKKQIKALESLAGMFKGTKRLKKHLKNTKQQEKVT